MYCIDLYHKSHVMEDHQAQLCERLEGEVPSAYSTRRLLLDKAATQQDYTILRFE